MKLVGIRLANFRNYKRLDQEFDPRVNVLIGDNGAGKTNLLEAIQCVFTGSSFRSHKLADLANKTLDTFETAFSVEGVIQKGDVRHMSQLKFEGGKRALLLDGKRSSMAQNLRRFSVVLFSPESLSAIKAGPSERRNLLDDLIVALLPESIPALADYAKCLRSRNRLLKEVGEFGAPTEEQKRVLASLTEVYLPLASRVTEARLKVLKMVLPEYQLAVKKILKNQYVEISVDYVISGKSAVDWDLNQVYDAQTLRLQQLASAELAAGQTLVGPHKHDVLFQFDGQDARTFCSQGQQRSLVLAMKIAQVLLHKSQHGFYPVLLLDDVLSELDPDRQDSLVEVLNDLDAQIFLTNTVYDARTKFRRKSETVFRVEGSHLIKF